MSFFINWPKKKILNDTRSPKMVDTLLKGGVDGFGNLQLSLPSSRSPEIYIAGLRPLLLV